MTAPARSATNRAQIGLCSISKMRLSVQAVTLFYSAKLGLYLRRAGHRDLECLANHLLLLLVLPEYLAVTHYLVPNLYPPTKMLYENRKRSMQRVRLLLIALVSKNTKRDLWKS